MPEALRPFSISCFLALAIAAALAILVFAGARLSWGTPIFANEHGLISGAFLFMAAITFLYDCRNPDWDAFSPFRLFYSTWFGVLALGCLRLTTAEPPLTARFWLTAILGLLGFFVGGKLALRGVASPHRTSLGRLRDDLNPKWRPTRALLLIGSLFLVGLLAFGYEWMKAGTVPLLADDPETARFEFGVNSFVSRLVISLGLTTVLGYLGAVHLRKHRTLFLIIAAASPIPMVLMTTRVFILTAVWMAVVLFHYGRRPMRPKVLLAVVLIAYPLAKIAVDVKRFQQSPTYNELLDRIEFPEKLRPFAPDYLYFSMTLRTLDYLTHLVPEEMPYSYGWYTAYPVRVFWTPRQGTGFRGRLDDLFWDRTGEISPVASVTTSYMGVPYADFGFLGVLLFSVLFGWISVRVYESLRTEPSFWRAFLYAQVSFAIFWSVYANYLTLFDFYWNILIVGVVHRLAAAQQNAGDDRVHASVAVSC
ncbi:MAG TPA: O-antigen polymerase [Candidatus Acidoferrum sp.]